MFNVSIPGLMYTVIWQSQNRDIDNFRWKCKNGVSNGCSLKMHVRFASKNSGLVQPLLIRGLIDSYKRV